MSGCLIGWGRLMRDIAVIVPAMRRPQNVDRLVESLRSTTDLADIYFIVDHDDEAEMEAVMDNTACQMIVNYSPFKSFATKCNLGYRETEEPWCLFVGDDVVFRDGWADAALAAGESGAFVSTNDLGSRPVMQGRHATHPMIARWWLDSHGASWDGAGTVCHEGYSHWYVDNEWSAVASKAGQFRYAKDAVIEHLHPLFRKGQQDSVYRLGQSSSSTDAALWRERRSRFGG